MAAATVLATANDAVKKDQATLGSAQQKLKDDTDKKASDDTLTADSVAISRAQSALSVDQNLLAIANTNFDQQRQLLGTGVETGTLTPQQIVPDPSARYVANLSHSAFRDDTLKLSATNGLLNSAAVTSTDQSLNSFVKLAETAISVASFVASGVPLFPSGGAIPAAELPPPLPIACTYDISEVFDPLNPDDLYRVNKILHDRHASIMLDVRPSRAGLTAAPAKTRVETGEIGGVFYRTAIPVVVTVKAIEDNNFWTNNSSNACPLQAKPPSQSVLIVVPDSRYEIAIAAKAGTFTTTQMSFNFSSGLLTDYSVNRPSEVAAPFDALSKLAQGVLAIPGSILKLRLDYTNNSADLVKAQTALINARSDQRVAVTTARKAMDDATAALIKAQFGVPQAFVEAQQHLLDAQQALQKLMSNTNTGTTPPAP